MTYEYEYPRPAVSADVVLLDQTEQEIRVLLIQRLRDPFQNQWALPGGFLDMDETLEQAAVREMKEETGLDVFGVQQIGAYSAVDRDPRGRVITVAFLAQYDSKQHPVASDDAKSVQWFAVRQLPRLAFDHEQIIADALATTVEKNGADRP